MNIWTLQPSISSLCFSTVVFKGPQPAPLDGLKGAPNKVEKALLSQWFLSRGNTKTEWRYFGLFTSKSFIFIKWMTLILKKNSPWHERPLTACVLMNSSLYVFCIYLWIELGHIEKWALWWGRWWSVTASSHCFVSGFAPVYTSRRISLFRTLC